MFQRLMAVIRSFFGIFIRGIENPEMLLRQYMDDIRNKVPKMRSAVADVMATEIQIKRQLEDLQAKIADYDKQIIAALKLGPEYEPEARQLIAAKNIAEESLEDTQPQWVTAHSAAEKAKQALDDYQRDIGTKINEARRLIDQAKMARMQEELASCMTSFEIGDQSDTLDRMKEKIDERTARATARVQVATSGVDSKLHDIRRATAEVGVEDKLQEYKRQLGLTPAAVEMPPAAKTMQPVEQQQQPTN